MSILACLIGILTLMISVAMQVQEANREKQPGEEHDRAIENAALKKQKEILARNAGELELRIQKERKTVAEMAELKDHEVALKMKLVELKKARDPKQTDAILQKIAENLKREIAALKKEHPPLDKRLKELMAQLKERREAPKPEESVIVRPGGSGSRNAKNIFFVECNSTGIVLLREGTPPKSISKATISTNGDYNAFLDEVKKTRDSMVLFLIRKAGNDSYRWAAGWAQSKYEVNIGKLPIPNDGKIDLSLFRN